MCRYKSVLKQKPRGMIFFQLKYVPNKSKSFLVLGRNSVNENGQNALPRVQIVRGDTLGAQNVHQQTAEILSNYSAHFELISCFVSA